MCLAIVNIIMVFTRQRTRNVVRGGLRRAVQLGAAAAAAVASQRGSPYYSPDRISQLISPSSSGRSGVLNPRSLFSRTKTKRRKLAIGLGLPHGKRRKWSKGKPQRPISSKKKMKMSKKFVKKVKAVVESQKNWGKYTAITQAQLRAQGAEIKSIVNTDALGNPFTFLSHKELLHLATVLFNGKNDNPDWSGTLIDDRIHLNVSSYMVSMFFKSTSSHVVNIEIFKCVKKDTAKDEDPISLVNSSYNNSIYNMTNGNAYYNGDGTLTYRSLAAGQISASASEWFDLYGEYKVTKQVVKLLPGDYTTRDYIISKDRTIDLSQDQDAGTLKTYSQGSVTFFFRIINDISVSAGAGGLPSGAGAGQIHAWGSNQQGGVALRITKHVRMLCPEPSNKDQTFSNVNTIRRSEWIPGTTATFGIDQQVAYQNPVEKASTD